MSTVAMTVRVFRDPPNESGFATVHIQGEGTTLVHENGQPDAGPLRRAIEAAMREIAHGKRTIIRRAPEVRILRDFASESWSVIGGARFVVKDEPGEWTHTQNDATPDTWPKAAA